ncbi:Toll-Interleukin-Resistance domain family protein [Prunus dulcis]|uniref:Toll-Interleukin-Resistance domain family protein n=1 Tax=Prunus dulcis TaxID=3755 RepID=A0A5H2XHG1_PRUDU|nr:Toll-Interleukin-Resistance domain family protein [Prunus dulcis]
MDDDDISIKQPHTTEADHVEIGKVFPNGSIITFRRRATPKLPGFGELKQIIMADIFSVKFSLNFAERKPRRNFLKDKRERGGGDSHWLVEGISFDLEFWKKNQKPKTKALARTPEIGGVQTFFSKQIHYVFSSGFEFIHYNSVRLVGCPKCRQLLPELPDFQVYSCGGCGATLKARATSKEVFSRMKIAPGPFLELWSTGVIGIPSSSIGLPPSFPLLCFSIIALLLMPAGYKASVSSALSYTALFFRFFPFTAYGLNHFRSLQSPFFILNSNLNLCKPWHASSPQQSQSLQTSQRWRSFDYSSASAEVGLMESYREKRRDLHIVFIELEKIYDRGSNDSSLGDYNEQINVASVPGSVDSNPSVSPLASISARVGSDDFNPRVSTDYDDSGTLASAVGPSGSNPPGSVAINIGLQVENNDPHHRTRVTALELTFMLVGFNLEILSAGFDQISSTSKPRYALTSLLLAVAGVFTCIWELIYNVIKERDASPNSTVFGTLPDIFGLGLAVIQCVCSAVQYYFLHHHHSNPMKLSPVPVFFFTCLVVLKLKGN